MHTDQFGSLALTCHLLPRPLLNKSPVQSMKQVFQIKGAERDQGLSRLKSCPAEPVDFEEVHVKTARSTRFPLAVTRAHRILPDRQSVQHRQTMRCPISPSHTPSTSPRFHVLRTFSGRHLVWASLREQRQ